MILLQHLESLATLMSNDDIADELYQRVDVPLKVGEDSKADGRKVRTHSVIYIIC